LRNEATRPTRVMRKEVAEVASNQVPTDFNLLPAVARPNIPTPETVVTPHKVLLVGEVNPLGPDPRHALYHLPRASSGNRLRCIVGLTDLEYHRLLDKVNLCVGEWSSRQAAPLLAELVLSRRGVVVLLGARLRAAARTLLRRGLLPGVEVEFFSKVTLGSGLVLVFLPHPSGLCRLWNVPGAPARARALLRQVAPQVPWGRDPETVP